MGDTLFSKFWPLFSFGVRFFRLIPDFIKSIIWSFADNKSNLLFVGLRYLIFSSRINSYAKNTYLGRYLVLKNIEELRVGFNVSIHDFCYLDAIGGIEIGNNVSIAHSCSLISFNHTWDDATSPIKYNPVVLKPVVIEDDVWIGCGVRIMPGVTIGNRSVLAAGSVVTKDVPAGTLVSGVPARVIRSIV
jgi:acetyltransferase-like isoleucine patch superfamily enzyme